MNDQEKETGRSNISIYRSVIAELTSAYSLESIPLSRVREYTIYISSIAQSNGYDKGLFVRYDFCVGTQRPFVW